MNRTATAAKQSKPAKQFTPPAADAEPVKSLEGLSLQELESEVRRRRLESQKAELEEIDREIDQIVTEKKVLDASLKDLRKRRWKILPKTPRERKAKPAKK